MGLIGWVALAAAGAAGASARYLVGLTFSGRTEGPMPWGTWVVNVTGSFLFGVLIGSGIHHGLARSTRVVLGVGFCGAFTTFSAFAVETVRLGQDRGAPAAVRYGLGTVAAALTAAAAGLALAASLK